MHNAAWILRRVIGRLVGRRFGRKKSISQPTANGGWNDGWHEWLQRLERVAGLLLVSEQQGEPALGLVLDLRIAGSGFGGMFWGISPRARENSQS